MTDPFEIPAFLRRQPTSKPRRRQTAAKIKPNFERQPPPKSWANAKLGIVKAYTPIYPPHFPTGYRHIWYVVGRKWVRVREVTYHASIYAAQAHIPVDQFKLENAT
jgi:hypothetical protein